MPHFYISYPVDSFELSEDTCQLVAWWYGEELVSFSSAQRWDGSHCQPFHLVVLLFLTFTIQYKNRCRNLKQQQFTIYSLTITRRRLN